MELYKVTGTFELVVRAYSEQHVADLVDSMISTNPATKEIFDLHVDTLEKVTE